jgi:RNA polymerase sigma-70 factor, ECF subfamily
MEITRIYSEFHDALLAYIHGRVRSKEDAEDILQNIFIRIGSNINQLSDGEKLRSWLFTISRNAVIDYYRSTAVRKNISLSEIFSRDISEDEASDPTGGLDQCLHAMISLLPDQYRDIVVDAELKGLKQKELADKYNMPYSSMRSRVQRGRERLKQLFYNCCHIETDKRGNVIEAQSRSGCDAPCNPCND